MHLQSRGRVVVCGSIGAVIALAAGLTLRPSIQHAAPAPGPVASTAPDPRSCKPTPPVTVALSASGMRGIWRIRLQATAPVATAELYMGTGSSAGASRGATIWRGSLAAGEIRDLEASYAPPAGVADVWAEVAADEGTGATQRARARLRVSNGIVTTIAELADTGRLVHDSRTGADVIEYPGGTAVGR
jgi:hypothetical protein